MFKQVTGDPTPVTVTAADVVLTADLTGVVVVKFNSDIGLQITLSIDSKIK